MKVVGIVAEYNPFHNGHAYQLQEAKRMSQADYAVVVMSGNYVQRGTPAIIDKYSRAKMALENGADMVFELPLFYATASAETFAYGAVSLWEQLNFVDCLSFGCETPSPALLLQVARVLVDLPISCQHEIAALQKQGLSYPAAREQAILTYFSQAENMAFEMEENSRNKTIFPEQAEQIRSLLSNPNNILALEYEKALLQLSSSIEALPLQRQETGYHDTAFSGNFASASAIRKKYLEQPEVDGFHSVMPASVQTILQEQSQKTFPVTEEDFFSLLYYKLSQQEDFSNYLDVTADFSNKIKKHLSPYDSFHSLADRLKSKDLVYTRICRNLFHILLNIQEQDMPKKAPYARLLGFRSSASHLLKNTSTIPIITKVANASKLLPENLYPVFQKELAASHLYNHVCFQKFGYQTKSEYEQGPIIL